MEITTFDQIRIEIFQDTKKRLTKTIFSERELEKIVENRESSFCLIPIVRGSIFVMVSLAIFFLFFMLLFPSHFPGKSQIQIACTDLLQRQWNDFLIDVHYLI